MAGSEIMSNLRKPAKACCEDLTKAARDIINWFYGDGSKEYYLQDLEFKNIVFSQLEKELARCEASIDEITEDKLYTRQQNVRRLGTAEVDELIDSKIPKYSCEISISDLRDLVNSVMDSCGIGKKVDND